MNHIIRVLLVDAGTPDERVRAYPNALPEKSEIYGGDTVTWLFDPATVRGRELQMLFTYVKNGPSSLLPTNPLGPLSSISLLVGGVVGTFRLNVRSSAYRRRFFYRILEDGRPLRWGNPVQVEAGPGYDPNYDGGGIDIPMTPGESAE